MPKVTADQITKAKRKLDDERACGDPLHIDLAAAALDDLLERYLDEHKPAEKSAT